jgi:hypothetical protein
VAEIWERRARRGVLTGKGRTVALLCDLIKERVAPVP